LNKTGIFKILILPLFILIVGFSLILPINKAWSNDEILKFKSVDDETFLYPWLFRKIGDMNVIKLGGTTFYFNRNDLLDSLKYAAGIKKVNKSITSNIMYFNDRFYRFDVCEDVYRPNNIVIAFLSFINPKKDSKENDVEIAITLDRKELQQLINSIENTVQE
jgi:hypothetical protein